MIEPAGSQLGQERNGATARVNQAPQLEGKAGRCMVTDMVKARKLTKDLVANFPGLGARAHVENKRDILNSVRFRAFFPVQHRTKSRKSLQKCAKTGKNLQENDRKSTILATCFIKVCQALWFTSTSKWGFLLPTPWGNRTAVGSPHWRAWRASLMPWAFAGGEPWRAAVELSPFAPSSHLGAEAGSFVTALHGADRKSALSMVPQSAD